MQPTSLHCHVPFILRKYTQILQTTGLTSELHQEITRAGIGTGAPRTSLDPALRQHILATCMHAQGRKLQLQRHSNWLLVSDRSKAACWKPPDNSQDNLTQLMVVGGQQQQYRPQPTTLIVHLWQT